MPWKPEHKERTRRRIVDAAATAFRERGVEGIGIADIMRLAGLTHGAFYAHFGSKNELVAAAQATIAANSRARGTRIATERPQDQKLIGIADAYLTSRHREHPSGGCSVATLGAEVARLGGAAQQSLDHHIRVWLDELSRFAPGRGRDRQRAQAIGTFAAMIGGMILARGVKDPNVGDRILADARAFLREALGGHLNRKAKSRRKAPANQSANTHARRTKRLGKVPPAALALVVAASLACGTVIDIDAQRIASLRGDTAGVHTYEASFGKGYTAVE